jgi:transposase
MDSAWFDKTRLMAPMLHPVALSNKVWEIANFWLFWEFQTIMASMAAVILVVGGVRRLEWGGGGFKVVRAKLGKCERTIRRLIKKWRDDGLVGLTQIGRSDKGSSRLDEDWQKFILKTYKEGNQGSKRMTRKQVAVMVKAKAEELQVKPPSHMSVYRILNLTFPVKFGWPTASPQLDHVI